jgi:hypothetical protein
LKSFSTGKTRSGKIAISIYFGATTSGSTCSDGDIKFAGYLKTLMDKKDGFVGQHCGWEEGEFLSLNAEKFKATGSRKELDESDGDEREGDESEGEESEEDESEEDKTEDEMPSPSPPKTALASTSRVKRVGNPKRREQATPIPPPTIKPTARERIVGQVADPKGKGRATQSATLKATVLPPPTVEPKSQKRRVEQVSNPKGKRRATPSAAPKASDPLRSAPQTSRSARRRQKDPQGVDEMETGSQPPPPPSEGRDAATKEGRVMLYDGFLDVVEKLKGTSHQSPQEWFEEICEKAREYAGLR